MGDVDCLLSRRSRQREQLIALVLSICLFVCLSVAKMQKKCNFLKKISNLELWCLLMTYRNLYMGLFKDPIYWTPKIQDG